MKINEILSKALEYNASDVIFSAFNPPAVRLGGAVRPLFDDAGVLDSETVNKVCAVLLDKNEMEHLNLKGFVTAAKDIESSGRFRISALKKQGGLSLVFRPVFSELPSLDAFGIPDEAISAALKTGPGIVLFGGLSSSGKSTTMASCLTTYSALFEGHVVTIEEPVEFIHKPGLSLFDQLSLGKDVPDVKSALDSACSLSPDILAIDSSSSLNHIDRIIDIARRGIRIFMTINGSTAQACVQNLILNSSDKERVSNDVSVLLDSIFCQKFINNPAGGQANADWQVVPTIPPMTQIIREQKFHLIDKTCASTSVKGFLNFASSVRTSSSGLTNTKENPDSSPDLGVLEKMLYDQNVNVRKEAEVKLKELASSGIGEAKEILAQFAQFYVTNFEDQKQGGIKR
jgi:Tfp pilus assembly pilus retraction ATPase PilT